MRTTYHNTWMYCHGTLRRYPWCPEDESCRLWWSPDVSTSTTMRSTLMALNEVSPWQPNGWPRNLHIQAPPTRMNFNNFSDNLTFHHDKIIYSSNTSVQLWLRRESGSSTYFSGLAMWSPAAPVRPWARLWVAPDGHASALHGSSVTIVVYI